MRFSTISSFKEMFGKKEKVIFIGGSTVQRFCYRDWNIGSSMLIEFRDGNFLSLQFGTPMSYFRKDNAQGSSS